MRTRIKICGITRPEDALAAAEAGADAIGLVFWPKSPRHVTLPQAVEICTALPPFVSTVGLFLDAEEARVEETLRQVPLDLLQFHGDECPADCSRYGWPYIKAIGMQGGTDAVRYAETYPDAAGFLLDSHAVGEAGGTGKTFDWSAIPELERPLILAGGLNPDNVAEAVRTVRPWAVDVSSGVESEPGIKDAALIERFISEVRKADE
ncbi:MAG: phosphoribosylanthranilate isomerase [Gammaproteobacteria bacterium]|nr:MAG: phosphoribosylanthranilate isomerase [Gammaproteobacteria bacterium]